MFTRRCNASVMPPVALLLVHLLATLRCMGVGTVPVGAATARRYLFLDAGPPKTSSTNRQAKYRELLESGTLARMNVCYPTIILADGKKRVGIKAQNDIILNLRCVCAVCVRVN